MVPLIVGGAIAAGSIASNLYNSYKNRQAASDAYDKIKGATDAAVNANAADINGYRSIVNQQYGTGASKYSDALDSFLNSPVYQNEAFTPTGSVEDYYDPFANQRADAAMNAINQGAATGGNRFSSDYTNRVAAKQQALSSEEWENAYNRLMSDRNQQLAIWQNNAQNAWNNYNATTDRAKYAVDAYGNDRDKYVQGLGEATMASMNNRIGGLQTMANVYSGKANAMQNQNLGGGFAAGMTPVTQFLSSYYNGAGS